MSFRLKQSESPAEGLRRIAREQAELALAAATATDRNTATRVHEVRKCTKKVRSLMRLVRPHLGDRFRVENSFLSDAARRLSASRDAAVLLATFDALVKKQPTDQKTEWAAPREVVVRRLSETAPAVDSKEQLAAVADEMRELLERIDEWTVGEPDFGAVGDGLTRSYRDGRNAMRTAFRSTDADDWHEWRKRVKDHWYHVRLLRNAWKPVMKACEKELETLSDLLGEEHDLAVLDERVADLQDSPTEMTSRLREAIARRRENLRSAARPLGARVYAEKPKPLKKRFRHYWRTWHDET